MSRHLVLGATGQVGQALTGTLVARGETVVGTGYRRSSDVTLDLGDAGALERVLDDVSPDVVWVVGAYTHVDGCEADPERSARINRDGPRVAVAWAAAHGARLVFYSTDYVFDGISGPYSEDDAPHPLSVYGMHKRAAETTVLKRLPTRGLVIRTAWVYSWEPEPKNFMQRLALNLARGDTARIPDDQWGNPTYAPDLAEASVELLEQGASGVMHVAGEAIMTRLAFARLIADSFGLSTGAVTGVPTASLGQAAPRPLRAGLKVDRCRQAIGRVPRSPEAVLPLLARAVALEP
jgi:dTDP-4-dehydrorhamnose reductase